MHTHTSDPAAVSQTCGLRRKGMRSLRHLTDVQESAVTSLKLQEKGKSKWQIPTPTVSSEQLY